LRAVRNPVTYALNLDCAVRMPRGQVQEIARDNPRSMAELEAIEGIRTWQVEALGKELVAALTPKSA
jgi:hypothetical protein